MEFLDQLLFVARYVTDLFLHLDVHLNELVIQLGPWLYVVLFLVIFCETGLVVLPFLPGDSLLFAIGALAAVDQSPLNLWLLMGLLVVAAVIGDACNYTIGRRFGPRIFQLEHARILNKKHLLHAQAFYDRHGGKTIILARFIPIVRTFAPFVAGIGRMEYARFATFNVVGALLWVPPLLFGGYFLGNLPAVKTNFHIIVLAIIVISAAPAVFEVLRARQKAAAARRAEAVRSGG